MDVHQAATGDAVPISENKHPYTTMKDDSHNGATLPSPATYDGKQPRRRRRARCCRFAVMACCCLVLVLVFVIGVGVLITWLVVQPKDGNYNLADADLNVFNLTSVGAQYDLDTDIDLKIAFGNPNKKLGFDIKEINVHALYAGEEIGQAALPPFFQPRRNDTILAANIRVSHLVFSEMAGGALQGEVARSNITLQVVMNAKVRNNHGMLESLHPYQSVHLTCSVSLVAPPLNGTSTPGAMLSKTCAVKR
jgi:hypothetical protein